VIFLANPWGATAVIKKNGSLKLLQLREEPVICKQLQDMIKKFEETGSLAFQPKRKWKWNIPTYTQLNSWTCSFEQPTVGHNNEQNAEPVLSTQEL